MVEHRLDQRLGGGTRIENGGADLETRPPKIPMADDSRHRLALQSPRRESRDRCGAGTKRTIGVANEIRVIDPERRAEKHAGIDSRRVNAAFRQGPRERAPRRAARHRRFEIGRMRYRKLFPHGAGRLAASSRILVSRAAKCGASAGFSPSISRASSKRSQTISSNFSLSGAPTRAARAQISGWRGIDFEHRLRRLAEAAAFGEHPFETAVRPAIGGDETSGARRQPVGSADILDRLAQDLFHERVKSCETGRRGCLFRRASVRFLLERNGLYVGRALGHRLEWLAVEANRRRHPKGIDRIRQQQNFDASRPETFKLRTCGQMGEILAEKIIDRRLVRLQAFHIVLEAPAARRIGRGRKARQIKQGVAFFGVLIKPFLEDATKVLPDLRVFFLVAFRQAWSVPEGRGSSRLS